MIIVDEIPEKSGQATKASAITKATIAGTCAGLITGALYAYFGNKKYLPAIITGAVTGGIIFRISMIKK